MEGIILEIKQEYPILNEARTFMVQGDFVHAADAYADLLELMAKKEKEDSVKMSVVYLEYANALILSSDKIVLNPEVEDDRQYIEDLEIAWEVLEIAKNVFAKNGMDKELFETHVLLSEIAHDTNNYALAKEDLLHAYKIIEKNSEEKKKSADILIRIALLEKIQNNTEEAISFLSSAASILQALPESEEKKELIQECMQRMEEIKNPEKYKVDLKKFSSIVSKPEMIKRIQIKKSANEEVKASDNTQAADNNTQTPEKDLKKE